MFWFDLFTKTVKQSTDMFVESLSLSLCFLVIKMKLSKSICVKIDHNSKKTVAATHTHIAHAHALSVYNVKTCHVMNMDPGFASKSM